MRNAYLLVVVVVVVVVVVAVLLLGVYVLKYVGKRLQRPRL
jgi:hypothetical protein